MVLIAATSNVRVHAPPFWPSRTTARSTSLICPISPMASSRRSTRRRLRCWQALNGEMAHAWYSHHLTFGYLLLMPFAYCIHRRNWGISVLLALGVLATNAQGPLYSLIVVFFSIWLSPKQLMVGGSLGVFALFVFLSDTPYFQERLAIWGSALELLQANPNPRSS